jgi:hypothetical protein
MLRRNRVNHGGIHDGRPRIASPERDEGPGTGRGNLGSRTFIDISESPGALLARHGALRRWYPSPTIANVRGFGSARFARVNT